MDRQRARRAKHHPLPFWFCSLGGGVVLLSYAIHRQDIVFILGQGMGLIVYTRNLVLIYRNRATARRISRTPDRRRSFPLPSKAIQARREPRQPGRKDHGFCASLHADSRRFSVPAVVVAGLAPASAQTTGAQTPPAPAGATPPPLPAPETVVARVGDQEILMADLLDMYSRLPQQYRERPIQMLFPSLRDRAIDSRLLGQAALDAKVGDRPVAKRRIRAAIDDVVAQIF